MDLSRLSRLITFAGLFCVSTAASAAEVSLGSFDVSGLIEVNHQIGMNGQAVASGRSLDAANNVTQVQWAELSIQKRVNAITGHVDLAFGEQADRLAGVTPSTEPTKNIPQAFITYVPTGLPELSLKVGKFYSFLGLERPRAKDNWNSSRSLAFSHAFPLWHQGVALAYEVVPETAKATVFLVNGWDGRIAGETNKSQTFGFKGEVTPIEGLVASYNLVRGPETPSKDRVRMVHDLNTTFAITESVAIAGDLAIGEETNAPNTDGPLIAKFSSWAVYGRVVPLAAMAISLRYEEFSDSQGLSLNSFQSADLSKAQIIKSLTATLGYQLEPNLEGRFEYRTDKSDRSGFYRDDVGGPSDHESTFAVALMMSF